MLHNLLVERFALNKGQQEFEEESAITDDERLFRVLSAKVQLIAQLPDRAIQLGQREETPVAQPRQDPSLRHLHRDFDLGLVAGLARPGRQDRNAIMLGHVGIGPVQSGVIAVGPSRTAGFKLSGTTTLGTPSRKLNIRAWGPIQSSSPSVATASA